MTDGVVCYGEMGKIVFCNPGMCVITGRSFEEILGKTSEEAWGIPIHFPESIHASAITEQAIRRPNGMMRYVSVKTFPLIGTKGLKVAIYRDETRSRNAMESMRRAEERLHDLLDALPIILWTADLNLVVTSSLGSGLDLIGYRSNEHQGQSLSRFFSTDDPDATALLATRRAHHGKTQKIRVTLDGRHFEGQISPLRMATSDVVGTVGILTDITETIKVRDALDTTSSEYKILFNESPVGNFVFSPTGRLVNCNNQFLRIFGFQSVDEATRTLNLRQWTNEIGESCLYMLRDQPVTTCNIQARRANGSVVHLQATIHARQDDDGDLIVAQGSVMDLSLSRKLDRMVGRAETHLKGVLSLCSVGMIHFKTQGRVIDIRADGLPRFAPSFQDLHGKKIFDHLATHDVTTLKVAMSNCVEGGGSEEVSMTLVNHGREIPLRGRLSLVKEDEYVLVVSDGAASLPVATESSSMTGESFAGLLGPIAHEMNNFLMGILGHTGLAMMDLAPEVQSQESLRMIEKTTLEASQFTSNLLAGSWTSQRAGVFSLQELLQKLTEMMLAEISGNIRLRTEVSQPLVPVRGVKDQLLLLLSNLIRIGADRLKDNGEIILEISSGNFNATDLSDCLGDSNPRGGTFARMQIVVEAMEGAEDSLNHPGAGASNKESRGLATCLGILRAHKGYIRFSTPRRGALQYEVLLPAARSKSPDDHTSGAGI